jgi:PAS domain S-box-containing protein
VFTPARISLLELLASQAAISLENSHLYQDLKEREAKIRRLVDANIIGIFFWNFEGRILEANDAFLRIIGYHRDDLEAGVLRWTDLTPPDWRERDEQWVREHKATGLRSPVEKEYFRKDGSRAPILLAAATFDNSETEGVGFVLDLTERKRTEEALRQRDAAIRGLADSNILGIVAWEFPDTRIIEANDAFLRMVGYEREDLVANRVTMMDLTPAEWKSRAIQNVSGLERGNAAQPYEKDYSRKDGSRARVISFGTLFDEGNTGAKRGVSFAIDLTERKRAEEALRVAQTELAHAARLTTLGELTASIAHEVNQPLTGIVTFGDACLRWPDRETPRLDQARNAVEQMISSARRASDVIRGLRALAKKSELQLARLDIDDVIREVLALTRAELQRHGVVLHTELAADRPILGDRVQLQQVLLNLIMNGVEAMRGVTERTRELIVTSTLAEPSSMLISVEDTGTGLDPAVAERVFEPFFTTKREGLGMGLSICRSIVEGHRGRLWASPRVPHGAAIRFTVPAELAR